MKNDVTIYVPTKNRHAFLRRVLDYYSNSGITILASDDSNKPFPDRNNYPNLIYRQTGLPYLQSVVDPGLRELKTPYVLMCADDTLISLSAIKQALSFLKSNLEYSVTQGYQSSLYIKNNKFHFNIAYPATSDFSAESASDRVLKFFASSHRLWWGLWRTDAWKDVYSNIPLDILNEPRNINCETMIYFSTAAAVKLKRLPIFFDLHEDVNSVNSKGRKNFSHWDFASKKEHQKNFEHYVEEATEILLKYEKIPNDEAKEYARRALQLNALHSLNEAGKKSFFYRVKTELRSLWNKTGGKQAYQTRKRLKQAEQDALNEQRLNAMLPECRTEMYALADFIYSYPRCTQND